MLEARKVDGHKWQDVQQVGSDPASQQTKISVVPAT